MNSSREDDDSKSKELLEFHFGSAQPSLAFLPHCLFRIEKQALIIVLQAANAKGGIFGDTVYWDREERIYLGVNETTKTFLLWELPKNQELVLERGWHAKLGQFTAVINSRTPSDVIRLMNSEANWMDYMWWIENIARWLPDLGWAYIPLTEDSPYAMFVARESDAALVVKIRTELISKGMEVFSLEVQGNKVSWPEVEQNGP